MPEIQDIIFCLQAMIVGGKKVNATNILATINTERIPEIFTFSVIISILDIKRNNQNTLRVEFVNPENKIVSQVEDQMPLLPDDSSKPDKYKGVTIIINWDEVNLDIAGLYWLKVFLNEIEIGKKSIYVEGGNEE